MDDETEKPIEEKKRPTVKVACMVPNGLVVRLYREGRDRVSGAPCAEPDGPAIRLNGTSALHTGAGSTSRDDLPPGITEVDQEWWDAWLRQNEKGAVVLTRQVRLLEEQDPDPNPTT